MKFYPALFIILVLFINVSFPQISGKITDQNNHPLSFVNVFNNDLHLTTSTDSNGVFSFNLPADKYSLSFEHIGFRSLKKIIDFSLHNPSEIIILNPAIVNFGEVTVTSTRFEQFIKDVPLSLEVIDKNYIIGTTSVSVPDALQNQPGIAILRDGIWGTDVSIRGLGRQNIVTLIDGNRIETSSNHAASLALVDVNDIDKIEILKGGYSSLYGTGAAGGVVNITTKTGIYTEKLSLSGSLISGYNSVNNSGMGYLSLASSSSNWYAKLSSTLRSAENTKTPSGILLNSQFRDNNLSAAIGVRPFSNQELLLKYQRFHGNDIGIPGGSSFPSAASAKYLLAERDMYSAEYIIAGLLPSLKNLSLKYSFQQIKRDVELKINPNATTSQILTPSAVHNTHGAQLQANWILSEFNQLSAGIDLWQRSYKGIRETKVINPSGIKITGDFPVPNSKYLSAGFFAQNETFLFDSRLKLLIGGRYDMIKVTNDDAFNPSYVITNGVRNDNPVHSSLSSFYASNSTDKSWSGNAGLLYSLLDDLDVTLNLAHAFRSPVQEERYQYINLGGNIYLGNPSLKPEQGNFLDLGFRVWKSRLSFKGNVFLNYFTDLVVDSRDTGIVFRKSNVGKARLYGYDLGFEYNFWENLVSYGNISYVRGENLLNHTNLQQIVPLNGRIGLRFPVLTYLYTDLSSTFFAKQNNNSPGEIATPGYAVFDFYLSTSEINIKYFSFKLYSGIENLFDKSYKQYLSTNRGFIKDEPGRNFFLKFQINW